MSPSICFHADEHIGRVVIAGLRRRGILITTSHESGLAGTSDESQLAFAHSSKAVLITQGADFLALHSEGVAHSGIADFKQGATTGEILIMLILLYDVVTAEEISGRVEYL